MIRVRREVPAGQAWDDLQEEAREKSQQLVRTFKHGVRPEIETAVYRKYKDFLLDMFHNKCAYCETLIRPGFHGDVEHYRPKGKVVEDDDTDARYEVKGQSYNHPGYFWLAYDYTNLLPSCQHCNQRFKDNPGKMNYFPLANTRKRAWAPQMLGEEEPLLLDPCDERRDPADHLFLDETGAVFLYKPDDTLGAASVKHYSLNRPELVEQRLETFTTAFQKYFMLAGRLPTELGTIATLKAELKEWIAGLRKYSAAAREAVKRAKIAAAVQTDLDT